MELLSTLPGAVAQGLIWGIAAIGVYITFRVLDTPDLTVDGSICTGAAVCAMLLINGISPLWSMLLAALAGALAGLVTACFNLLLGIPAILSGILTQLMLFSINLKVMGRANTAVSARSLNLFVTQMDINSALWVLALCLGVLILLLYLFFGTELGASIRATGSNEKMSRAQGINTAFTKALGLAISNAIVAFSGALLCQYQGAADINMGRGAIVIALAAVVVGEAIIAALPKNFALRLFCVSLGAVVYYIVYQIIIFVGLDTDLLKMFSAVVVALFLGLPYIKRQLAQRGVWGGKKNA